MSPRTVPKPTAARQMQRRSGIGDGINPGQGGRTVPVLARLRQGQIATACAVEMTVATGDKAASDADLANANTNAQEITAFPDMIAC